MLQLEIAPQFVVSAGDKANAVLLQASNGTMVISC